MTTEKVEDLGHCTALPILFQSVITNKMCSNLKKTFFMFIPLNEHHHHYVRF